MTIKEIANALDAKILSCEDENKEIHDYYVGDFLSRVMGKAPSGSAWFTVMANVNVAGVAVLAEIRAIILCEGVTPDANLLAKCVSEGLALLTTAKNVFDCCKAVG